MTTIERVIRITGENEKDYTDKLNKEIKELEEHNMDYSVYESRYNSEENGYKAEIEYWFDIEESYYEYYC